MSLIQIRIMKILLTVYKELLKNQRLWDFICSLYKQQASTMKTMDGKDSLNRYHVQIVLGAQLLVKDKLNLARVKAGIKELKIKL